MTEPNNNLKNAYALTSPHANQHFYDGWAGTYDAEFAKTRGYRIPGAVAQAFAAAASPEDVPVLDIGAGTGLVAEALGRLGNWTIDALDISSHMLETARAKALYRDYLTADLTRRTALTDASYGAAISAGTFTHGHLGANDLDEVLRLLRPGALVAITINESHFDEKGFRAKFKALEARITAPVFTRADVYANRIEDGHDDDTVLVTIFRKRH